MLGIDPLVDYVFKRLFGDPEYKSLLIRLLNAVLRSPTVVEVSILNPFNEKEFPDDKLSVLDIKARGGDGVWYNIEIQGQSPWSVRPRLAYYGAGLFVDQLTEGQTYVELTPAITICFLREVLFRETAAAHLRFSLSDCEHRLELTDRLQIHTIELAKYNFEGVDLASADELVRWAYFLTQAPHLSANELKQFLPGPDFVQATEILEMIALTPEQRMQYEARRKAEMDHRSFLKDALQEGQKLGLVGEIQLLQRLLRTAVTSREELIANEMEALVRMRDSLEADVKARNP